MVGNFFFRPSRRGVNGELSVQGCESAWNRDPGEFCPNRLIGRAHAPSSPLIGNEASGPAGRALIIIILILDTVRRLPISRASAGVYRREVSTGCRSDRPIPGGPGGRLGCEPQMRNTIGDNMASERKCPF